ncbi:hypothetical protein [Niveispirillum sp. SYP-B3756]|uniref:hypothetical protein n=1 Tax=Niveispirillum sp. SYP-B3756 TaxID=2662178 RepID=UPI00156395BB|nr:hypothetical protein [Niveispirillum sp. SYP-B3756]
MNAETEGDAESPKRRGRIPQSAWPRILERHRAGVTLSAIAREFDCTPSAISYIVRKAEAAGLTADAGPVEEQVSLPIPAAEEATPPEALRPPRRVKTQAEPLGQAPAAVPPPAEPVAEAMPVATTAPVTASESDTVQQSAPDEQAIPAGREGGVGELFQHDSGRHEQREAGRRFESREGRPPRDRDNRERDNRDREGREPREPRFAENGNRGDRNEGRTPPQEGRRPQQGVPRFPQGGQRFSGRDRQEGSRDTRPPRDFDRGQERPLPVDANISDQPSDVVYPYRQQQRNPARLEAQETPTVPADERMDIAAKACAEAYRMWKSGEGDVQSLGDSIHELRKVIARMEIEVSASRKEEQRPVPIPSYRRHQPPPQAPRG